MKVNGQSIISTKTHYIIELSQPYWSAYQRFGWEDGIEGFGISQEIINQAVKDKKKLIVRYKGDYEITPTKALKTVNLYHSTFIARNNSILGVIPRTSFKRLPKEEDVSIPIDTRLKLRDLWREKIGGVK